MLEQTESKSSIYSFFLTFDSQLFVQSKFICLVRVMFDIQKLSSTIKKFSPYFILPIIISYLLMNILDGNNGLQSHSRLNSQIFQLKQNIESTKLENKLLNIKISLMQPDQKNDDLIDENVRKIFGYGKNNEYTIYFN